MEDKQLLLIDQYADIMRQRITSNVYGSDGTIPSMNELQKDWGVKNVKLVRDVIILLRVQGYIVQSLNRRYRAVNPRIQIQIDGLTPNFRTYVEELGYALSEVDIETAAIVTMPDDIASIFTIDGKPVVTAGAPIIKRARIQGLKNIPLRVGHIFYPANSLAPHITEYLKAMQSDSSFDLLAALKRDTGKIVELEETVFISRVALTPEERKELHITPYNPLMEVRRICLTADGEVLSLHRTIADATRFTYRQRQTVTHWSK